MIIYENIRLALFSLKANKMRSLLGKPVCIDKKWYDVGQDPRQGNLNRPE